MEEGGYVGLLFRAATYGKDIVGFLDARRCMDLSLGTVVHFLVYATGIDVGIQHRPPFDIST
jgi:hypothetical protein